MSENKKINRGSLVNMTRIILLKPIRELNISITCTNVDMVVASKTPCNIMLK
jgi:hypothetical protein